MIQENIGQYGPQGLDMNVEAAWMQGITGEGVRVALVDDGSLNRFWHSCTTNCYF